MIKNTKNINIKEKKFCISFIGLIIIFALILKLLTLTASTSDMPTLWINDEPFQYDARYPLELINGVPYAPLMFFEYLKHVETQEYEDGFYIRYKLNNSYILFDSKNNEAVTFYRDAQFSGRIPFYEMTYVLNGIRYVRVQVVGDNLGIDWDYIPEYGGVLRIKDRSARKTLKDLISKYIEAPTSPPTEPTTKSYAEPPTTTIPPIPIETEAQVEPTTPENTREIVNYFMFHSNGRNYSPQEMTEEAAHIMDIESNAKNNINNLEYLLNILKRENIQSIFFLTEHGILDNPIFLRKIYAMGHEIGIEIELESGKVNPSFEDVLTELEKANAIIYTVTKQKTRFYMLDENIYTGDNAEELRNQCIENLKKEGYYQFKETFEISNFYDYQDILISESGEINDMIEFLKREEINIIKFEIDNTAGSGYKDLDLIINAVQEKFYITVAKISLPFFLRE